jgi:hypothetical protein
LISSKKQKNKKKKQQWWIVGATHNSNLPLNDGG